MYWLKKIFKWAGFLSEDVANTETPDSTSSVVSSVEDRGVPPTPTDDETVKTIVKLRAEVEKIRDEAKDSLETARDTRALVFLGFFILLFMIAGLVFAYWQFTYSANREIRDQLIENKFKMLDIEKDFQAFKKCLEAGGWKTCF